MNMLQENRHIMVVDDNTLMLELVTDMLSMEGFKNVLRFNDPRDAIKAVCNGEYPHIVISDYNMPYFSGTEFLFILERFVRNVTSVIITADPFNVEGPSSKQYRILDKNTNFSRELKQFMIQTIFTLK